NLQVQFSAAAVEIASKQRQTVELLGGELHLLIFEQAPYQLRPRVFDFFTGIRLLHRQQHARLDLDEQGRHEQVLSRQFEILAANLLNIGQILARDIRHGNVQHIE